MPQESPPAEGNDIGTRTETFLGEFRMIIPAMAAILGFQLMVAFQQSFGELAKAEQVASFAALACTTAAFLLLLMPASYHRFTWEFEETEEFLRFSRRAIAAAFLVMPFIVALTLYVQAVQVFDSRAAGAAAAGLALAGALVSWWAIPMHRARSQGYLPHPEHREGRPPRPRQGTGKEGGRRKPAREAKVRAR